MRIIVFATRFKNGVWMDWEHECDEKETEAVVDSANAKSFGRAFSREPLPVDFLGGARYIFDRARGTLEIPADGDTLVYGVSVDGVTLARSAALDRNFAEKYGRYSAREYERRSA